jgi:hypothetical protein
MKLLELLFGTWTGLLSLFTVVVALGVVIFLAVFFATKMQEPGK